MLNSQHALLNPTNTNPHTQLPTSTLSNFEIYNCRFLPPTISVSSSLALSGHLLQAPGPYTPSTYTSKTRSCGKTPISEVVRDSLLFNYEDHGSGAWKSPLSVASSGGYVEENFEGEMLALEPFYSAGQPAGAATPQEDSVLNSLDPKDTGSNIENIERRAKASIEKLRHILYSVKTRTPENSGPSEGYWGFHEGIMQFFLAHLLIDQFLVVFFVRDNGLMAQCYLVSMPSSHPCIKLLAIPFCLENDDKEEEFFCDTNQHDLQDKVEIQIQNPLAMRMQLKKESLINKNESCTMNKTYGQPIHNLKHIHTTMQ